MDEKQDITQETIDKLKSELEVCRAELAQAKERILYAQAEFDNYKKRYERERATWFEAAQDSVLIDILPLLDDTERALKEMHNLPENLKTHVTGFEIIRKSLEKILKKYDVEEIQFSKTFNPEYFDAVMQVASENHQPGEIVAILQKGYTRKGRVLRPAQVSVAQTNSPLNS